MRKGEKLEWLVYSLLVYLVALFILLKLFGVS